MAASAPLSNPVTSEDITFLTSEPFEPTPLIADILRTRFCVPDSVFLVEGIEGFHTSSSKGWRGVRLLLGDGELCIQALLAAEMHRFADSGEIVFGSYVRLQRFRVESKNVTDDHEKSSPEDVGSDEAFHTVERPEKVVYLIVDSLIVVGWSNSLVEFSGTAHEEEGGKYPGSTGDDDTETDVKSSVQEAVYSQPTASNLNSATGEKPLLHDEMEVLEELANADDDFNLLDLPKDNDIKMSASSTTLPKQVPNPRSVPRFKIKDPSKPLKLTKLRAIPNLPYKQNWSVNLLCIVSAISDVEPAGIPPYTQRQARLTDPSTDKHVLLTVFLDAHLFAPVVGSVVLLLGVKNHRFDGGCVKKYASDRPQEGESWWYENPARFAWLSVDVEELRRWWDETGRTL
ncbi:hypothetical protein F5Y16DRAFT_366296 [Xylariaceae sp. FL0255]|nr:hypothetical protein F5Y16DRAFT_366296 [Xylariaceae sp. FL0255]